MFSGDMAGRMILLRRRNNRVRDEWSWGWQRDIKRNKKKSSLVHKFPHGLQVVNDGFLPIRTSLEVELDSALSMDL